MVEEIPLSDHDQTKDNILISEDQFFQKPKPDLALKKPANAVKVPAQKKLIPFAADDEDDVPAQVTKVEPPLDRPQFIRKRGPLKENSPVKDLFNTTKDSKTTVSTNSNRKSTFLFGTSHQGASMLMPTNNLRYS